MSEHPTSLSTRPSSSPAECREHSVSHINVGDTERWLSAIGGGALLLYGLRRSLGSLTLAVGGGMLLYRGVTGHCKAYESLGLNSVDREGGGVEVEATITVYKYKWDQFQATTAEKVGDDYYLFFNTFKFYHAADPNTPTQAWILSDRFQSSRILKENIAK